MVQRGGDVITHVIPDAKSKTLLPHIENDIEKGSTISSDELHSYKRLRSMGYKHGAVKHKMKQWRKGIHCTNQIEGFWSQIKRSIQGTHVHVSRQHLAKYLKEFEYRYNMRETPELMFSRLLLAF